MVFSAVSSTIGLRWWCPSSGAPYAEPENSWLQPHLNGTLSKQTHFSHVGVCLFGRLISATQSPTWCVVMSSGFNR